MRIDDIDALLATVQFSSPLNQAAEYLGIAVGHHPAPAASGTGAERHAVRAPDPPADPDRRRTSGVRAVSEH